ncbi:MAG UNVERIFIED_CONTAM: helix-turn-helix domain-containing protein [Microcystis novacekii LVE1205-3]|jgi:transposase-like protein
MSPRKLTDATKKEILKLYRETEATTSTLAERYGVSSSTVSRFLKNSFLARNTSS